MKSDKSKLSRREFLRLSAIAGAGAALAACAPQATPAAVETEAPEETPAPPEPTEMSVSHWWGDGWMDWGGSMLAEKLNLKIDSQNIPFSEYTEKTLTQLAGGVGPDMVLLGAPWKGPFLVADIFEPLDDALAASDIDNSKWWVDPMIEDGYKGRILGLEMFAQGAQILHVNKEMTDAAGIKLPEWGTPEFDTWRWDDFVEFLNAVTQRDSQGNIEVYGVDLLWQDFSGPVDYNVVQFGGKLLDDDVWNFEEKECLVNSPEAVAGIQAIIDLVIKHNVAPSIEARGAIEGGAYRAGKAASTFFWTGHEYYGDLEFEQTWLHFPWEKRRCHYVGGNSEHVNKASKVKDKVIEAVLVLTTDWDIKNHMVKETGNPSGYETLAHTKTLPEGPALTNALIAMSRVEGMSECDHCTEDMILLPRWKGRHGKFVTNTITSALQGGLLGQDLQELLDDAKAKIDEELATG